MVYITISSPRSLLNTVNNTILLINSIVRLSYGRLSAHRLPPTAHLFILAHILELCLTVAEAWIAHPHLSVGVMTAVAVLINLVRWEKNFVLTTPPWSRYIAGSSISPQSVWLLDQSAV